MILNRWAAAAAAARRAASTTTTSSISVHDSSAADELASAALDCHYHHHLNHRHHHNIGQPYKSRGASSCSQSECIRQSSPQSPRALNSLTLPAADCSPFFPSRRQNIGDLRASAPALCRLSVRFRSRSHSSSAVHVSLSSLLLGQQLSTTATTDHTDRPLPPALPFARILVAIKGRHRSMLQLSVQTTLDGLFLFLPALCPLLPSLFCPFISTCPSFGFQLANIFHHRDFAFWSWLRL